MADEQLDLPIDEPSEPQSFSEIAAAEMSSAAPESPSTDPAASVPDVTSTASDVNPAGGGAPEQGWREAFSAAGLNIADGADLASVAQALKQSYDLSQQLPSLQRYAAMGYQMAPHYQDYQAWLTQRGQPQQAAPQQQPQQYAPQPQQGYQQQPGPLQAPEYDPEWERLVKRNPETGLLEPISPYVDPSVPQKIEKYYAHQKDVLTKFAANPMEFIQSTGIADQFRQEALNIARHELQQSIAEQQRRTFIDSTIQQHSEWMYAHDQQGRPVVDHTGNKVLTQEGMQYAQALNFVQNGNPMDPEFQDTLATLIVQARQNLDHLQAARQAPAAAPAAQVDPKAAFVGRKAPNRLSGGAGSSPQRVGSLMSAAANGEPQNSQHVFRDMLREAFGLQAEGLES